MLQLTYKNYFKFGFNNTPYTYRQNHSDKWFVEYSALEKHFSSSWYDACIQAAKLINQSTDKPIIIAFSGGIDSEMVVNFFREAGIDFTVGIIQFNDNLNDFDIKYALDYCRKNNIKYSIFNLDIKKLWKDESIYKMRSSSPQFYTLMWFMQECSKKGLFPVLGSGECLIKRDEGTSDFYLYEKEIVASLYYYLMENKIEGVAGFFQYTPDQILTYLTDPFIVDFCNTAHSRKILSSARVKHDFYTQFFPLIKREKYTGYEKVKELDQEIRVNLERIIKNETFKTPIQTVIQSLQNC